MDAFQKAEAMTRLYSNKDFQTLILDDFINQGILTTTLTENIASEVVLDQLKARKILYQYCYDIIDEAKKLKLDNEDN
jgi:hypothetical protein